MPKFELTPEQKAVVENRGGTLLVSAAAGSGKTKVFIDRVLKRVEEENRNIDEFLMITFTKAAASELRGKLIAQLSERLSEQPNNRHLQKQMSRVYLAQISTVHSFCSAIIREYAHLLNISGDFRLCDEQEGKVYRERAMRETLENAYRAVKEEPQIAAALDMFGHGRDDRALPELLEQSFFALQCYRDPKKRLRELNEALQTDELSDVGQTVWGEYLIDEFHMFLDGAGQSLSYALSVIDATDWLSPYRAAFASDIKQAAAVRDVYAWEEIRSIFPEAEKLGSIKNCPDAELKEQIRGIRDGVKKQMAKWKEIFAVSSEAALADLALSAEALRGFLTLTDRFAEAYQKQKAGRRVVDYNDLEHLTLRLLVGTDGSRTRTAKEISERFAEIMVDEYQDTNRVQDAIFRAVSRDEKNLFFVGDVKQSIYRFRLADPTMFLEKYRAYVPWSEAKEGQPRKILLSDNFRSSAEILSAANDVFRLCMTERVGGLRYTDAEALRPKASIPKADAPAVELHCADIKELSARDDRTADEIEAELIARRIETMLTEGELIPDGDSLRPVRPEDIVILCRGVKDKADAYIRTLARHRIRCVCGSDNIFQSEEIRLLTALLQVIDNPHQDIPLLTVLLSPLFCVSPDTLALAHAENRDGDLFTALSASENAKDFLAFLKEMRLRSRSGSLHELLNALEDRLYLRALFGAMDGGEQKVRNIERFYALADSYENGERFGLGSFLSYLEILSEKGVQSEDTKLSGAVRLMTMHSSKGLEFPIVFLADLCGKFNTADTKKPLLVDPVLGIGSNVYLSENRMSYPTVAKLAIAHRIGRENVSEEMRILYVAMTRAKYKMILTCCGKALAGTLKTAASEPPSALPIETAGSFSKWILLCAMRRTEAGCLFEVGGYPEERVVSEYPWKITFTDGMELTEASGEQARESIGKREHIIYQPMKKMLGDKTPSKITATQLKGRDLDNEIEETPAQAPPLHFAKPRFSEEKSLSAAQKGTAIHLAMQYLRFERCGDLAGIEAELDRLVSEKFISAKQREAIPARKILNFFASDLGRLVLHAENLIREFKFSVLKDGTLLNPELQGEKILLQGVTDCAVIEPDGLTIIDFKSDRVTAGAEEERAAYYKGQLDAYSEALSEIFALPVKARYLYFFSTDKAAEL